MWWIKQPLRSLLGYRIDPEELEAYRTAIPSEVTVHITHADGSYVARISEIDNRKVSDSLITEAENDDELVLMVNDLVLTYKNVPERLRPYLKKILRPAGSTPKNKNLKLVKA